MPKIKNWFKLFISIVLCEGAGIIGSIFTFSAIPAWYQTLNKPVLVLQIPFLARFGQHSIF